MTRLHFEAPIGQRILRSRFMWITTFGGDEPLWWDGKQWTTSPTSGYSNCATCHSYKAFLRHLKKHKESLKGYEVVLVHRYIGFNIVAVEDTDEV